MFYIYIYIYIYIYLLNIFYFMQCRFFFYLEEKIGTFKNITTILIFNKQTNSAVVLL